MERVKGQKGLAPETLTNWEGRRAYAEAKAAERSGLLKGPFDAKQAAAHLATLSSTGAAKTPKR